MRESTAVEYNQRLTHAVRVLVRNLNGGISAEEVAVEAGFSRFHFSRIFTGAMGESLTRFFRRLRLERAAFQLRHTKESVTGIGIDAGYESLESFIKAFRSEYLVQPTAFRRAEIGHEIQCVSGLHWSPTLEVDLSGLLLVQGEAMEAEIKSIDPIKVVALRHVGPYNLIGSKFGPLSRWAGTNGVPLQAALALYHDNPSETPPQELKSDACLQVSEDFKLENSNGLELRVDEVPGGTYARATHWGPYEGLGDAWARFLGQAVPSLGKEPGPITFEIYMNDCSQVKPEEIQTDLYCSVLG